MRTLMKFDRMRPGLLCLFLVLLALVRPALALDPALIPAAPEVGAKAYILVDHFSGRVLAENNADQRLEPASLTKIMTAYVVFRELRQGQHQVGYHGHGQREGLAHGRLAHVRPGRCANIRGKPA